MPQKINVVGNWVDIPCTEDCCDQSTDNNIIFVGKMSYEPNIIAVSHFVHEIFPKVRAVFKDLSFQIIGADPVKEVLALNKIKGVNVTGFIPDIKPCFKNSTIVIAPMLTGAGIQNKIIQAMSFGCCVATSPIGAEGLHIVKDEIKIYNTVSEWIDGLINLLSDKNLRLKMGTLARDYVKQNLSEDIIRKEFASFIGL